MAQVTDGAQPLHTAMTLSKRADRKRKEQRRCEQGIPARRKGRERLTPKVRKRKFRIAREAASPATACLRISRPLTCHRSDIDAEQLCRLDRWWDRAPVGDIDFRRDP